MNKYFFYGLAIMLVIFSACKPNDPQNEPPRIPISDQRLKDAATVKPGSYFIYLDSATGTLDSFGVNQISLSTYQYDNGTNAYYEYMGYQAANRQLDEIRCATNTNKFGITLRIRGTYPQTDVIVLPHVEDAYHKLYSTYTVLGVNYSNVYEMNTSAYPNGMAILYAWYSLHSGLIKFRIKTGNGEFTYLLKSSKVIK